MEMDSKLLEKLISGVIEKLHLMPEGEEEKSELDGETSAEGEAESKGGIEILEDMGDKHSSDEPGDTEKEAPDFKKKMMGK